MSLLQIILHFCLRPPFDPLKGGQRQNVVIFGHAGTLSRTPNERHWCTDYEPSFLKKAFSGIWDPHGLGKDCNAGHADFTHRKRTLPRRAARAKRLVPSIASYERACLKRLGVVYNSSNFFVKYFSSEYVSSKNFWSNTFFVKFFSSNFVSSNF